MSLVGVVLVFLLITGLNKCIYQKGAPHHHQVMNWVDSNVSDDAPIGTIQVGTLGYCQDQTIYLYGKVNPEALLAQRPIFRTSLTIVCCITYVVDRKLWHIADWFGIADWANRAPIDSHIKVGINDYALNLDVLRHHSAPQLTPP